MAAKKKITVAEADKMPEIKANSYISTAMALFEYDPKFYNKVQKDAILSFAKFLDSGKTIGLELQLIAAVQAHKIDRELITLCCEKFGKEEVTELAKIVQARRRKH